MQLPASFSLLAVRMWWHVVLVLALLGAVGGMVLARDAQYSATTSFRVDVSSNPIQSVQIVATALQLVDSDPVYARVVGESRDAINELRSRTTVGVRDTSTVLFVTIVAPTSAQAERDADVFAEQTVQYLRDMADSRFASVTEQGQRSLQTGVLPDPVAEEGRLERLGLNLADGQDSALRSATLVERLGGVQNPVRLGVSPTLAVPLGGLAGGLLGVVLALSLGVRRRRIRSVNDLRSVAPHVRVYPPVARRDAMLRVAARSASLDHPVVALLAMPGAESVLADAAAELRGLLHEEGLRWLSVDADDLVLADSRAALTRPDAPARPGSDPSAVLALRRKVRSAPGAPHLTLVTGVADAATIAQVSARADVSVLVAATGVSRVGQIAALCAELAETHPVVVLGEPSGAPGARSTRARLRRWGRAGSGAANGAAEARAAEAGTPLNGTPVNGTPVNGTSVNGTPVNGTPVNGTPVTGTPAVALTNGTASHATAANGTGTNGTGTNGTGTNGTGTNGAARTDAVETTTRLPAAAPTPSPTGRANGAPRPSPVPRTPKPAAARPGGGSPTGATQPALPTVVPAVAVAATAATAVVPRPVEPGPDVPDPAPRADGADPADRAATDGGSGAPTGGQEPPAGGTTTSPA